jgi:hypothetical protein
MKLDYIWVVLYVASSDYSLVSSQEGTYQLLENGDLILERLVVLNASLLHGLNRHFYAYIVSA